MDATRILLGKGQQPVQLLARYGNRHGLIAGATGTGKTVSLMAASWAARAVADRRDGRAPLTPPRRERNIAADATDR
jgi:helicase HerA-like protein